MTNRNADGVLSADALKLVVIIDVFFWLALFLDWNKGGLGDFSVLYTSGGVILEGHRALLFDMQTQYEFQHRILGMHGLLPFNHLAYESLLFIPMALMPCKLALGIWRMLSVGMLLLSTRLLADTFHSIRTQVFVLSISLFPVAVTILQGQDSILLLLLLSASLAALTRGQERRAGVLIALALFKPHLVLPIAAVLIWKLSVRFLQGFLGASVAVFLLSIGITGLKGWQQMGDLMRYAAYGSGNQIGGIAELRPNLRGMIGLLGFGTQTAVILTIVTSIVLFLLVAWQLRYQHSPALLFPPLVTLALLTSVHVNAHDLTLLFIPVLAMLVQNNKSMSICAGACFCMPLFWLTSHTALFFFVICAVLFLTTIQQHKAVAEQEMAVV